MEWIGWCDEFGDGSMLDDNGPGVVTSTIGGAVIVCEISIDNLRWRCIGVVRSDGGEDGVKHGEDEGTSTLADWIGVASGAKILVCGGIDDGDDPCVAVGPSCGVSGGDSRDVGDMHDGRRCSKKDSLTPTEAEAAM